MRFGHCCRNMPQLRRDTERCYSRCQTLTDLIVRPRSRAMPDYKPVPIVTTGPFPFSSDSARLSMIINRAKILLVL